MKRSIYAEYGVREYWIVDLEARTVEVMTLTLTGYTVAARYTEGEVVASPLLPGLHVDVTEILAPLI